MVKTAEEMLRRRQRVSLEIIETEEAYLKSLQTVQSVYIEPLTKDGKILTKPQMSAIFANLSMLSSLHETFLESLKESFNENGQQLTGSEFQAFTPYFNMYKQYINNHMQSTVMLAELARPSRRHASWQKFHRTAMGNPKMGGQSLESLLIMPIQRIPRYQLLLQELMKNTPPPEETESADGSDEARIQLVAAVENVTKIAGDINEAVGRANSYHRVYQVQHQFRDDPEVQLVHPTRAFVRRGPAVLTGGPRIMQPPPTRSRTRTSHSSSIFQMPTLGNRSAVNEEEEPCELILFNDLLVYARYKPSKKKTGLDRKMVKLQTVDLRNAVSVEGPTDAMAAGWNNTITMVAAGTRPPQLSNSMSFTGLLDIEAHERIQQSKAHARRNSLSLNRRNDDRDSSSTGGSFGGPGERSGTFRPRRRESHTRSPDRTPSEADTNLMRTPQSLQEPLSEDPQQDEGDIKWVLELPDRASRDEWLKALRGCLTGNKYALGMALRQGHAGTTEVFSRDAPDTVLNGRDELGQTPLIRMMAQWDPNNPAADPQAHVRTLKALLSSGRVDVAAQDENGFTALMLAADAQDEEAARVLLAAGAPLDAVNRAGMTALRLGGTVMHEAAWQSRGVACMHDAAQLGDARFAMFLAEQGCPLDSKEGGNGESAPLLRAVSTGNGDVADVLFRQAALQEKRLNTKPVHAYLHAAADLDENTRDQWVAYIVHQDMQAALGGPPQASGPRPPQSPEVPRAARLQEFQNRFKGYSAFQAAHDERERELEEEAREEAERRRRVEQAVQRQQELGAMKRGLAPIMDAEEDTAEEDVVSSASSALAAAAGAFDEAAKKDNDDESDAMNANNANREDEQKGANGSDESDAMDDMDEDEDELRWAEPVLPTPTGLEGLSGRDAARVCALRDELAGVAAARGQDYFLIVSHPGQEEVQWYSNNRAVRKCKSARFNACACAGETWMEEARELTRKAHGQTCTQLADARKELQQLKARLKQLQEAAQAKISENEREF